MFLFCCVKRKNPETFSSTIICACFINEGKLKIVKSKFPIATISHRHLSFSRHVASQSEIKLSVSSFLARRTGLFDCLLASVVTSQSIIALVSLSVFWKLLLFVSKHYISMKDSILLFPWRQKLSGEKETRIFFGS